MRFPRCTVKIIETVAICCTCAVSFKRTILESKKFIMDWFIFLEKRSKFNLRFSLKFYKTFPNLFVCK